MGKSRGNTRFTEKPMVYNKETGEYIPKGNLDDRLMNNLLYHLKRWLEGHGVSPDEGMEKEEVKYIMDHMKSTEKSPNLVPDGHLYRIENAAHFSQNNLDVGKNLSSGGAFSSFSKDISATNMMLEGGWRGQTDIVIYRTVGNTPFFDTRNYSDPYPYQKECFVPTSCMKIKNINEYTTNSRSQQEIINELKSNYGLDVSSYFKYAPFFNGGQKVNSIKVVDVGYDSTVTTLTSFDNHAIDVPSNILE